MKLATDWIRTLVPVTQASTELAARLTMAGLECEVHPSTDDALAGVLVGRIVAISAHPDADRLRVCSVDIGSNAPLTIVCGASNAREGIRVAVATVGTRLPNGMSIAAAEVRGVASHGMLCSAQELGLEERSDGLLELDAVAPLGKPLSDYLGLGGDVIEFELTPNRGDCLSVLGIARELSALYRVPLQRPEVDNVAVDDAVASRVVHIERKDRCPVYCGRVIDGIDPAAKVPDWMREYLRRSGLRSVSAVVDITNYVMLALGQPLHAFSDEALTGAITVRQARAGESLRLLNDQLISLCADDLIIADDKAPVALAGVMGGGDSEMGAQTTRVFLESACFLPQAVAGTGRRYKLHTDAAHRYERGVDPALARQAIEHATRLIIDICGGRAGAVTVAGEPVPPAMAPVRLRHARMEALLGLPVSREQVRQSLEGLGMQVAEQGEDWTVVPPSYRYDIGIEADLVEEVIRMIGYERIPSQPYLADVRPSALSETQRSEAQTRSALGARGYQEVVCYSFVDPEVLTALAPEAPCIRIDNPIAETMAVMRTTLWAGLLPVVRYNRQRQQRRVRIFELAHVYHPSEAGPVEHQRLAGAVCGNILPEQWDAPDRESDFYDVKADIDALFSGLDYVADTHPALHPGRSARVSRAGEAIGWIGQVHPRIARLLEIPSSLILFELDWAGLATRAVPREPRVSDYPASRRDLAFEVPESVPVSALQADARAAGGAALKDVIVFDVYRGEGLRNGCRSVALGLIFQDYSRTLVEQEVDGAVQAVIQALHLNWGASIRG